MVGGRRFTQQKFLYGTAGVQAIDESRWSPKVAVLRRFGASDTVYANLSERHVAQPGFVVVEPVAALAAFGAGGQSVEVQLALRNLFDKHCHVSSHLHVSRWITPGQGRNVALSATYRF